MRGHTRTAHGLTAQSEADTRARAAEAASQSLQRSLEHQTSQNQALAMEKVCSLFLAVPFSALSFVCAYQLPLFYLLLFLSAFMSVCVCLP